MIAHRRIALSEDGDGMHVNVTIGNDYKKSNQSLNLNAVPKKSNQAFVSKMKY
jgi:hypothetical protein